MAKFSIVTSRKSGIYSCELDVRVEEGTPTPGEVVGLEAAGMPMELVILAVLPQRKAKEVTLVCLNWVLHNGQFTGVTCESRPMNAAEKRRYAKHIVA